MFSLPLFVFCHDRDPAPEGTPINWRKALSDVVHTIRVVTIGLMFVISALIPRGVPDRNEEVLAG